jgi:hypothetical protein
MAPQRSFNTPSKKGVFWGSLYAPSGTQGRFYDLFFVRAGKLGAENLYDRD